MYHRGRDAQARAQATGGLPTTVRLTRAHARPYAHPGPAPSLGRRPGHRLCSRRPTAGAVPPPPGGPQPERSIGLTIDTYRFCVIGPGRLGSTVLAGLLEAELTVAAVGVHADDDTSLFDFVPHVRVRDAALEADAWWLAVPDDEIYTVAGRLAEALPAIRRSGAPQPLAVHSSGLGSVHLLKPLYEQGVRVLCLHPLQTFAGEPRRRAAAGRSLRRHGARGTRPAARRGARPPPRHAARSAWPTSRRRSTTSRPSSAATCWWRSRARPSASWTRPPATTRGLDHLSVLLADDDEEPAAERRAGVRAHRAGRARRHRHRARAPAPARPREPAARAHVPRAQPRGARAGRAAPRRRAGRHAAGAARGRRSRRRSRRPRRPGPAAGGHWAGGRP